MIGLLSLFGVMGCLYYGYFMTVHANEWRQAIGPWKWVFPRDHEGTGWNPYRRCPQRIRAVERKRLGYHAFGVSGPVCKDRMVCPDDIKYNTITRPPSNHIGRARRAIGRGLAKDI